MKEECFSGMPRKVMNMEGVARCKCSPYTFILASLVERPLTLGELLEASSRFYADDICWKKEDVVATLNLMRSIGIVKEEADGRLLTVLRHPIDRRLARVAREAC